MALLRLPGLIDPHVHVRDLGQAYKEDWDTATAAALAGGITAVLAMPNTQPPIVDAAALAAYEQAAQARARCDYGLYLGAGPGNLGALAALAPRAAGLKLYLDSTFGDLKMDSLDLLIAHCAAWPADRPLLAHAEGNNLAAAILAAHLAGRAIHIAHVSRQAEIELIRAAKLKGFAVTCEVCPHHLFLTLKECGLPPGYIEVRPRLAAQADAEALWANLEFIDCFATDHAPHTRAEKAGPHPPPGYPGLETALALWLTAVHQGRLTLDDVVARMHTNPRRIFRLPEQPDTWVEVDPDQAWTPRGAALRSRAGWTPFEGWIVRGRVVGVTLRGRPAYAGENVLSPPGAGRNLHPAGLNR